MKELADLLTRAQVRYCVLHSWQSLPVYLSSDWDIVVDPEDLRALERILQHHSDWQLVQLLQHEVSCFYFVLAMREGKQFRFIPVDAATDYRRDGRIFFTADELLAGRRWWNGFWVASPRVESAYLLVKKILKGAMPDRQKKRLAALVQELGDEARSIACRLFGKRWGDLVVSWISTEDWNVFEANLPCLRRALLWQVVRRDLLNPLRYWIPESWRIWRRWWYPTGLFVAVLGPDGAGKSTLIQHLRESLAGAFRRTEVFHLRPGVITRKGANRPVTDPHGKPPHPLWLSLLKIPYFLFDYLLGYLFKVRPKLVRSTLVLFDRYYDDLLVDPHRYRYGGPQWLAQWLQHCIPYPDLLFILDAPQEHVLRRKQELPADELQRQRREYHRLAIELPNAILLDAAQPEGEVTRQATQVTLDMMHERYMRRAHLWFGKDESNRREQCDRSYPP
jgi:thymidylate kinase